MHVYLICHSSNVVIKLAEMNNSLHIVCNGNFTLWFWSNMWSS